MFVLDTKVKGFRNTEQMDIKMAEMLKKKTRRGKKNRMRKSQGNTSDVFSTLDSRYINVKRGQFKRNFIRPTSPKAPMNSTQFLIEDRGLEYSDFETTSCNNSPAFRDHGLSSDVEDFTNEDLDLSFYDSVNDSKHKDNTGEVEYMPIDLEVTADFIDQEFEKDFNSHHANYMEFDNISTSSSFNLKRRDLAKLPKYTIVQKMLNLEDQLQVLEKDAEENSQDNLKMKIQQLLEENSSLKIIVLAQV